MKLIKSHPWDIPFKQGLQRKNHSINQQWQNQNQHKITAEIRHYRRNYVSSKSSMFQSIMSKLQNSVYILVQFHNQNTVTLVPRTIVCSDFVALNNSYTMHEIGWGEVTQKFTKANGYLKNNLLKGK